MQHAQRPILFDSLADNSLKRSPSKQLRGSTGPIATGLHRNEESGRAGDGTRLSRGMMRASEPRRMWAVWKMMTSGYLKRSCNCSTIPIFWETRGQTGQPAVKSPCWVKACMGQNARGSVAETTSWGCRQWMIGEVGREPPVGLQSSSDALFITNRLSKRWATIKETATSATTSLSSGRKPKRKTDAFLMRWEGQSLLWRLKWPLDHSQLTSLLQIRKMSTYDGGGASVVSLIILPNGLQFCFP